MNAHFGWRPLMKPLTLNLTNGHLRPILLKNSKIIKSHFFHLMGIFTKTQFNERPFKVDLF